MSEKSVVDYLVRLPSGRWVSTWGVRDFDPRQLDERGACHVTYHDGRVVRISLQENIDAFDRALTESALRGVA